MQSVDNRRRLLVLKVQEPEFDVVSAIVFKYYVSTHSKRHNHLEHVEKRDKEREAMQPPRDPSIVEQEQQWYAEFKEFKEYPDYQGARHATPEGPVFYIRLFLKHTDVAVATHSQPHAFWEDLCKKHCVFLRSTLCDTETVLPPCQLWYGYEPMDHLLQCAEPLYAITAEQALYAAFLCAQNTYNSTSVQDIRGIARSFADRRLVTEDSMVRYTGIPWDSACERPNVVLNWYPVIQYFNACWKESVYTGKLVPHRAAYLLAVCTALHSMYPFLPKHALVASTSKAHMTRQKWVPSEPAAGVPITHWLFVSSGTDTAACVDAQQRVNSRMIPGYRPVPLRKLMDTPTVDYVHMHVTGASPMCADNARQLPRFPIQLAERVFAATHDKSGYTQNMIRKSVSSIVEIHFLIDRRQVYPSDPHSGLFASRDIRKIISALRYFDYTKWEALVPQRVPDGLTANTRIVWSMLPHAFLDASPTQTDESQVSPEMRAYIHLRLLQVDEPLLRSSVVTGLLLDLCGEHPNATWTLDLLDRFTDKLLSPRSPAPGAALARVPRPKVTEPPTSVSKKVRVSQHDPQHLLSVELQFPSHRLQQLMPLLERLQLVEIGAEPDEVKVHTDSTLRDALRSRSLQKSTGTFLERKRIRSLRNAAENWSERQQWLAGLDHAQRSQYNTYSAPPRTIESDDSEYEEEDDYSDDQELLNFPICDIPFVSLVQVLGEFAGASKADIDAFISQADSPRTDYSMTDPFCEKLDAALPDDVQMKNVSGVPIVVHRKEYQEQMVSDFLMYFVLPRMRRNQGVAGGHC